jgi:hypothetical protein
VSNLPEDYADEHDDYMRRLKPARSQAELVRTRNSNVLLGLAIAQVTCNIAVALRIFHII